MLLLSALCAVALLWPTSGHASQAVLDALTHTPAVNTLGALSATHFTALTHPAFPKYSVRVKKSDFCDGRVASYTGYIDVEARHLFFYFFESRSSPDTDDVILWTNGGPGCSSSMGLFMELGPCRVKSAENGTVYHPESWNSNANIFFIDQPIGAGFSYADYGESVSSTDEAAKDIAAFVAIFFAHFTSFQGRAFHIAGESYAGRIIPVAAAAVYDQNALLRTVGIPPVNLSSIMLGNGFTDVHTMLSGWYDIQCSATSIAPVQGIQNCVSMKKKLPRCRQKVKESCKDIYDEIDCTAAMLFCIDAIIVPFFMLNRSQHDITRPCNVLGSEVTCYEEELEIKKFLNRLDIQEILGVDPSHNRFATCNLGVMAAFGNIQGNVVHGSTEHVAGLLERGVRALVYAGEHDFICNWVANEAWTRELEWSGREAFAGEPLREWVTEDGAKAGKTRSASGLTFASIRGAGHMAPYDKPKESLEMVQRWIAGKEL